VKKSPEKPFEKSSISHPTFFIRVQFYFSQHDWSIYPALHMPLKLQKVFHTTILFKKSFEWQYFKLLVSVGIIICPGRNNRPEKLKNQKIFDSANKYEGHIFIFPTVLVFVWDPLHLKILITSCHCNNFFSNFWLTHVQDHFVATDRDNYLVLFF